MSPTSGATPPSRRRRAWVLSVGVLAVAAGLGARWVAADDRKPAKPAVARDVPHYEDGVIRYSETYAERIGLRVEEVTERALAPVTEVTGEVELSPAHVASVGAQIFGRVRKVHAVLGQVVEEGERLAALESSELGRAQAELVSARARVQLAKAEDGRKRTLVAEGIAAHRSVEVSATELKAAQAQLRATEQDVRAMGGSTRTRAALGKLALRSPIAGEVIEANVFLGQAVGPEHVAFTVADLDHLWLELAVFAGDLPLIAAGDEVLVQPHGDLERGREPTLPGDAVTGVPGRVAHVGSVIDPVSRTATVRVELDNRDRALRVGQAVRARIVSRGAEIRALTVPRRAVVLVDGAPTVFVVPAEEQSEAPTAPLTAGALEGPTEGRVEPRAVELGLRGEEHVEVRDGLQPGDRVVVDGVFALKSELFR